MHVPQGFASIAPYLMVTDADDYVAFLVAAFGGTYLGTSRRPDGSVANAQVPFGTGDTVATVMVGEARTPDDSSRIDLMLYVPNAPAALARAVAAGAKEIMAIDDMPYGDRQGGVVDRRGVTWWLSQRLTAAAYDFE